MIRKLKVSAVDNEIMQSGSKVSNPTVLSSECTNLYPLIPFYISVDSENDVDQTKSRNKIPHRSEQGCNARKVNCGRVYSAYTWKPVLFGRNL